MRKILTLLLFATLYKAAHGQFNDTTHYHVQLASTGSINTTDNSTAYLLNNALNFGIKQKDAVLTSTNSWIYGKQDRVLTNNDFSSALFFNLYKTFPHFYYWGLLNYNTSYSLKINNQLLTGAGIAYSLVDTKKIYINISDGVVYDQSDLLTNLNYHTYRNSLRIQYHFELQKVVTLDGGNFFQNSFAHSNDYIIRTTTTLGLKLQKWLSLTTTLTYNKMNITQSDNLIFTYGVSVDKFF